MKPNNILGTPQKRGNPSGMKPSMSEQDKRTHMDRMKEFRKEAEKRRGFKTKYFSNPQELVAAVDEYLDAINKIGLFPTEAGLCTFLDCSWSWYKAVYEMGDERSEVLRKFAMFCAEYVNQSGLSGESNTIFSIYYLKSKMGQYDSPDSHTINVNLNQQFKPYACEEISAEKFSELMDSVPIEIDFQEIEENETEK